MKKKVIFSIALSLLLGVACSKGEIAFEECNDVFTESFYEEIEEIVLWSGNIKYIVDNKEKRAFFAPFSTLTLNEKPKPETGELLYGGVSFDFVMKDGLKHDVTILGGEIRVDGVFYNVDKDIVEEVTNIALGKN